MFLTLACWLPILFGFAHTTQVTPDDAQVSSTFDNGRGTPFRVLKADNLCGLSEARQLTVPAQVDYLKLLHATTEYKELLRRKLDPKSAQGIALLSSAKTRVIDACETARVNGGYCSVWRKISRRDGAAIPKLTAQVLKRL